MKASTTLSQDRNTFVPGVKDGLNVVLVKQAAGRGDEQPSARTNKDFSKSCKTFSSRLENPARLAAWRL